MYLHRRHSVVLALSAFRTIPFQDDKYHVIRSRSKVLSTNSDNSESVTTSLHPLLSSLASRQNGQERYAQKSAPALFPREPGVSHPLTMLLRGERMTDD
jgi:hypothetical protein